MFNLFFIKERDYVWLLCWHAPTWSSSSAPSRSGQAKCALTSRTTAGVTRRLTRRSFAPPLTPQLRVTSYTEGDSQLSCIPITERWALAPFSRYRVFKLIGWSGVGEAEPLPPHTLVWPQGRRLGKLSSLLQSAPPPPLIVHVFELGFTFLILHVIKKERAQPGLNSGPPAPKPGIIPLDHWAVVTFRIRKK